MVSKEILMEALIKGRFDSYVRKDSEYNPYKASILYDWDFKLEMDNLVYADSYRGYNPYSGVEYLFEMDDDNPIWSCDYVGYVKENEKLTSQEVYLFLKEARGNLLQHCNGDLFKNYNYENGYLQYQAIFSGDIESLLQIENFYFENKLIAQQISSGRCKKFI